jgi:8-oxo-dGTP diphosphatase
VDVGWTRVGAYALCRDDDGRILLTRFAFPGHPDHGKWTMPGGGMDRGESPRATACRELLEETGLTATLGSIAGVFSRWFTAQESVQGEQGHFVGVLFHGSQLAGQVRTEFQDLDTTDGAQWFAIEQIEDLPHVKFVDFVLDLVSQKGTAA